MSLTNLRAAVQTLPAKEFNETGKIYYMEPYLFVNEINEGIHIIDNSNPSAPKNIAFINIPGNIDIAVKGNTMYADSYIDLVALDISDPMNVTEAGRVENIFPDRVYENGWTGDPTQGVIVNWIESDTTVTSDCNNYYYPMWEGVFVSATMDIASNSSGLTGTSSAAPGIGIAGSTAQFAIVDDYLYCLDSWSMDLFDITNPTHPVQTTTVQMPWNIETIFPYEDYIFIGSTTGVQIYDNSNPATPTFISQFVHIESCDPVVVQGNYAYSTLRSENSFCGGFTNELDVIDISDITNPQLSKTYNMSSPYGLGIDNEYLFICDKIAGLKMYDVSDPLDMQLLQTVNIQTPIDVIPVNGLLIVITENAFYQYDYSSGGLVELSWMGK
ncbi:MAG: hypothetical protein H7Y00_14145 [Fimbriimonadaceae bacterium]|nr:hypothetical protein [Chitinophagales bacterium]